MRQVALVVVALVGCMRSGPVVESAPGDRGGYAVVRDCADPTMVGVLGRGQRWFDGIEPDSPGRPVALARFAADVVAAEVAAMPAVASSGPGAACHGDGVRVLVHHWRDVDGVVDRLGTLLRVMDLREEIAVGVAPPS
jgi:hypothetical protein